MSDKKKALKIGVIGCGWAGETLHLPALQSLSNAEVIALADIDQERLNQVGDKFHIKNRHSDFRNLIENEEIEAIAVCVPASSHAEIVVDAIDGGKHVFIEKPLALSMEEVDLIMEKAKCSTCKTTVGFNLRSHRLIKEARKIIQQGALGKIESVRTEWTSDVRHYRSMPGWRNKREEGGGTLIEIGIHHFDLWRFLLGSEVEYVSAMSRSYEWDDEIAAVNARMTDGTVASSVFSELTSNNNEIEIHGRNGCLLVSCYRFDGLEFQPILSVPSKISTRAKKIIRSLGGLPKAISAIRKGGEFMASYRAEWQHFIHAIQNDAQVECSLEDARHAVQIALAATQSASLGQPIKIAHASRKITPVRLDGRVKI
jgi:myo-inositol 2-dehydrogenase/D-chiro-inositol 1-dehydrogenase